MGLTSQARSEYLQNLRERYPYGTKSQKKLMLDEFCAVCGYNRKYAIRLLNSFTSRRSRKRRPLSRGRKKTYCDPLLLDVLWEIWRAANQPCAKRLKALLPLWLPFFKHFIIPDSLQAQLLRISAATIDRLLASQRKEFKKRGRATTKPGAILKKRIPIQTNQWDQSVPGFLEAVTVAHCGDSTQGQFVYTVNCVDIASGWTAQRAVWGRGERGVLLAIKHIEATLPFALKGFDCLPAQAGDNDSEFLNWHLIRYLMDRPQPVQFTRSRAYYKNDNAHVENKNWTHIRQLIGYERFEQLELVELLNDLYNSEWNDYFNFFIPSVKLYQQTTPRL